MRFYHSFFLVCLLINSTCKAQEGTQNVTAIESQNTTAKEIPITPPAAMGRNPSGVNMTLLTDIQGQMDNRLNKLEDQSVSYAQGLDLIEQNSPRNLFKGVELNAEVVDPKEIGKQLEEYKRAQKSRNTTVAAERSKSAKSAYVGELTPPIIILEPYGEDPLQKYMFMRLLTCRQASKKLGATKATIQKIKNKITETAKAGAGNEENQEEAGEKGNEKEGQEEAGEEGNEKEGQEEAGEEGNEKENQEEAGE